MINENKWKALKEIIARNPQRLDLGVWHSSAHLGQKPHCGTVHCIAGFANILEFGLKEATRKYEIGMDTPSRAVKYLTDGTEDYVERDWMELFYPLGAPKYTASMALVHMDNWLEDTGGFIGDDR